MAAAVVMAVDDDGDRNVGPLARDAAAIQASLELGSVHAEKRGAGVEVQIACERVDDLGPTDASGPTMVSLPWQHDGSQRRELLPTPLALLISRG